MNRNLKTMLADQDVKRRFVCSRLHEDGIPIEIAIGEDQRPLMAWLTRLSEDELIIESSDPDAIGLNEVYEYFRGREMTSAELWREITWIDPRREYDRKVQLLSENEKELFEAASESVSKRGAALAHEAGHEFNGNTKMLLSFLVKYGLLAKAQGGYLRVAPCDR